MTFNHNDIGQPNGNYFALPYETGEGDIEIISVPWDVTTSYNAGTSQAPKAVIDASAQVDLFDVDVKNAWEIKISSRELPVEQDNKNCRKLAEKVINHLENGGNRDEVAEYTESVNRMSERVNLLVYNSAKAVLDSGRTAAVVGGDHSTPFGLIKAVAERYTEIGILHIDAHADLRKAYEGFVYSHASIMYNTVTQIKNISKLVQVAVRDFCEDEYLFAENNDKILMFTDDCLNENRFAGKTWKSQCEEIISSLPKHVYISFDIDGLSPEYCPNTGTPVAGGLDFSRAVYLLKQLAFSGRKIVGFDLNEVGANEWDANTGARILFKLCCYTHYSQTIKQD